MSNKNNPPVPTSAQPVSGQYPQISIIELACSTANSENNAEYEVILPKPFIIDDGDQISIKSGYINSPALSGANITLTEDTTVAMEFGFYIINGIQMCDFTALNNMQYYFIPEYEGAPNGPGQPTDINMLTQSDIPIVTDGNLYVWHEAVAITPGNPLGFVPIIDRFEIVIKAGSYTPQQLATRITERLSDQNGQVLQGDQAFPSTAFVFEQLKSGSRFFRNATTEPLNNNSYWLSSYTLATDRTTLSRFRFNQQAVGPAPLAPNNSNTPTYMVGASQLALDYNSDSQTFQWSFIHTPMTDPVTGDVANALYRSSFTYNAGVDNYIGPLKYQTRQSGVFFTKLEPESFWNDLGFDIPSTVVDISNGISTTEVNAKTTNNQLGLSTILARSPAGNSIIVNQSYDTFQCQYLADTNIVPLQAQTTYRVSESGFFLISLDLGFNNDYSDGDKVYSNISAIASKQWQANDFVSMFGDSAIPYIHHGSPYQLQSAKVKIMDKDKNIVRGLKPNSSIFIQIVKGA